jgi:hypothetical protein
MSSYFRELVKQFQRMLKKYIMTLLACLYSKNLVRWNLEKQDPCIQRTRQSIIAAFYALAKRIKKGSEKVGFRNGYTGIGSAWKGTNKKDLHKQWCTRAAFWSGNWCNEADGKEN